MRYFAELAYLGTHYYGWQKQPKQISVQQVIEEGLSRLLNAPIEVVGCGRTDTGVHAKQYFLHFDSEETDTEKLCFRLNKFLPKDISFKRIFSVALTAHARFDASNRAYEYHLSFTKNPFTINTAYFFPQAKKLDIDKMQATAKLLLDYNEFFPFCKTNSDAKTMHCDLRRSEWILNEANDELVFHVASDRFLRGMVRLIVGACLKVGMGKVKLADVAKALDNQERLNKSYSAPPQGLYLNHIDYTFV